jgi:hypothetical protein
MSFLPHRFEHVGPGDEGFRMQEVMEGELGDSLSVGRFDFVVFDAAQDFFGEDGLIDFWFKPQQHPGRNDVYIFGKPLLENADPEGEDHACQACGQIDSSDAPPARSQFVQGQVPAAFRADRRRTFDYVRAFWAVNACSYASPSNAEQNERDSNECEDADEHSEHCNILERIE